MCSLSEFQKLPVVSCCCLFRKFNFIQVKCKSLLVFVDGYEGNRIASSCYQLVHVPPIKNVSLSIANIPFAAVHALGVIWCVCYLSHFQSLFWVGHKFSQSFGRSVSNSFLLVRVILQIMQIPFRYSRMISLVFSSSICFPVHCVLGYSYEIPWIFVSFEHHQEEEFSLPFKFVHAAVSFDS